MEVVLSAHDEKGMPKGHLTIFEQERKNDEEFVG